MYGIYVNSTVIAQFVAPISVVSNVPIFVVDALSLKRNVSKRPAQRWEILSNLEPLSYDANKLFSLFVKKGHSETISVTMPQNYGAIKTLTTTGSPTATGTAGNSSVTVASNNGTIPEGTFIKFANHSKIYMLTETLSGNGTMYIFPNLYVSVSGTGFAYKDNVIMTAFIDTDSTTGMVYTDGILMDLGSVKLVESL